jgi:hypothetical protein
LKVNRAAGELGSLLLGGRNDVSFGSAMTLLVNNFTRGADGVMRLVEPTEHSDELAGFETYRWKVYGSATARSLGMRILPQLASGDVYVEGTDVSLLLAETELALAHIDMFAAEADTVADSLRFRFQNIAKACQHASNAGGGVVIW